MISASSDPSAFLLWMLCFVNDYCVTWQGVLELITEKAYHTRTNEKYQMLIIHYLLQYKILTCIHYFLTRTRQSLVKKIINYIFVSTEEEDQHRTLLQNCAWCCKHLRVLERFDMLTSRKFWQDISYIQSILLTKLFSFPWVFLGAMRRLNLAANGLFFTNEMRYSKQEMLILLIYKRIGLHYWQENRFITQRTQAMFIRTKQILTNKVSHIGCCKSVELQLNPNSLLSQQKLGSDFLLRLLDNIIEPYLRPQSLKNWDM